MNKQYYLENKEEIEDAFVELNESKVICREDWEQTEFIADKDSVQSDRLYFNYEPNDAYYSTLYILEKTTDDISIDELQDRFDEYLENADGSSICDFFDDNDIEYSTCFFDSKDKYAENTICYKVSDKDFLEVKDLGLTQIAVNGNEEVAISGYSTFATFISNLSDAKIAGFINYAKEVSDNDNDNENDGSEGYEMYHQEEIRKIGLREFVYSFDIQNLDDDIIEIIADYVVLKQIEKGFI